MRVFKQGDIVSVSLQKIDDLKFVPNLPEKVTNPQGTITSTFRLYRSKYPANVVTVRLDEAPNVPNLEFDIADITLVIPVELDTRLKAIESQLALLAEKE